MSSDVFISYSSKESAQAGNVRDILVKNGISCWMAPESIPFGSNYAMVIPKAIAECKVFLLILSKQSQESKWVQLELDRAMNSGKIIYPLQIEDCDIVDPFDFMLSQTQRVVAYENAVKAMQLLVTNIKRLLGINDVPEPHNSEQKSNPKPTAQTDTLETQKSEEKQPAIRQSEPTEPTPDASSNSKKTQPQPQSKKTDSVAAEFDVRHSFLCAYNGNDADVVIPEGIIKISAYCFKNKNIKSVTIPATVTEIETHAFDSCASLEKVDIKDGAAQGTGLVRINTYAFNDCTSLRSITLPSTIKTIGHQAFTHCHALHEIILPEGLEYIEKDCFWGSGLISITVPKSVKLLGKGALTLCSNLRELDLACEEIGASVCSCCWEVTNIRIRPQVKSIGAKAFKDCRKAKVVLENPDVKTDKKSFNKKAIINIENT